MADIGDWASAAGGIPLGIIQGYNLGQKLQRDEEKALADIEQARLRNELMKFTSAEYMGPEQTATRSLAQQLQQIQSQLGIATGGAGLEATQARRQDLVSGLGAQIGAAAAGARTQEQRALLDEELFPQLAGIQRAVTQQDVELLPQTLGLRAEQQQVQRGQAQSALRQLDELTVQSGAVNTIRDAVAANPNASPYDQLYQAFQAAPAQQKAIIAARMNIADTQDLGRIGTVAEADAWLQRPGRQVKSRAWREGNQLVVAPIVVDPQTGQPAIDTSKAQRFASWEEFKRQYGAALPRGTPQGTQRPAATTPQDVLRLLGGQPRPAVGAATPAAAPAAAPATGVMPLPALGARAAPAPTNVGPPAPQPLVQAAPAVAAPSATVAPARPSAMDIKVMLADAARGGTRGQEFLNQLISSTGGDISGLGLNVKERMEIQGLLDAAMARAQRR
jgi:hypothetical protein